VRAHGARSRWRANRSSQEKTDLAIFDLDVVTADPLVNLVECGRGMNAWMVMVDGEIRVDQGRLIFVDADAVIEDAKARGHALARRCLLEFPSW
jgi:cytosine/adenosine deaminase-related metal-dependent hydrolase